MNEHSPTPLPDDAYTLPPFEFKLYAHYRRACQETGVCPEAVRHTAERAVMSIGQVVTSRDWLETHGWIRVTPPVGNRPRFVWIIERSYSEQVAEPAPASVHTVNTNPVERSLYEHLSTQRSPSEHPPESFPDSVSLNTQTTESIPTSSGHPKTPRPRARDPLFDAITEVCRLNPKIEGSYIAKTKQALRAMDKTPEDIQAFGVWWFAHDWRGQKDQPPSLHQLVTLIEQARASPNGRRSHPDKGEEEDPDLAARQHAYLQERMKQRHAHRPSDQRTD